MSIYIPSDFLIDDENVILDFLRQESFGTLITHSAQANHNVSNLPFLIEKNNSGILLKAHLAKHNAQSQEIKQQDEVNIIFNGPHAYISPTWYEAEVAVPTWNYCSVLITAKPELISKDVLLKDLAETINFFEPDLPSKKHIPLSYMTKLAEAIVGYHFHVTNVEAKFKLSQNKSQADRESIYINLSAASSAQSRELAKIMKKLNLA